MLKKITLLILIALSINIFSQEKLKGNGIVSTIKKELSDFNKIIINNDFKVTLIKSETSAIEIETDENLHEAINFNVSDSTFVLRSDNKIKPKKTLNITVFCTKKLNEIELNNNAEIATLNSITLSKMNLKINDFSKANLNVKSQSFNFTNNNQAKIQLRSKTKLNLESSFINFSIAKSSNTHAIVKTDSLKINLKERGTLEIEGNTTKTHAVTNNNTNFKGKKLTSKETHIEANENSGFSIQTYENLTIEASGKSKIEVYGNPQINLKKFNNTAKIYKKELTN